MKEQRYLITFELAFIYALIMSAIVFVIIDSETTSSDTLLITNNSPEYNNNPDMSSSIPFEPIDICICDLGLKIAHREQVNACGCQDGKGQKCTCESCECTSCVR
jgi:hypothetical protein